MQIEIIKKEIVLIPEGYNENIRKKCNLIGMKWRKKPKIWWMHDSLISREMCNRFFDTDFEVGTYDFSDYKLSEYLRPYQEINVNRARKYKRWGFFDEMGTGKTITLIEIIKMLNVKTLIVCPLSVIPFAWMKELKKFAPQLSRIDLWEVTKSKKLNRKIDDIIDRTQINLINFESFKKIKHVLERHDIKLCIIDESSKIKNSRAAITKNLTEYCDNIPFVYELTGTPAYNHETEYFSQISLLDPTIFGRSFYKFRLEYFYPVDKFSHIWKMKTEKRTEFLDKISSISSVVRKKDVIKDLPERTDIVRSIQMSEEEQKSYDQMKRDLLIEIEKDKTITAFNAGVKGMKLRQITSGFVFDSDKRPVFLGKSKLNELISLLEEIGNRQVIIWIQFHPEVTMIWEKLTSLKKNFAICNSKIPKKQKFDNVRNFMKGDIQYLIAHPRSLGHGTDGLQEVCSDAIYYSMPYGEVYTQSRDRIDRPGQVRKGLTCYYLLSRKSVDEVIHRSELKKEDTSLAVLNYIKMSDN